MNILNATQSYSVGRTNWTKDQLKLAFYFYCQTPFGKLHSRNLEIINLAKLIHRTPSAIAMKLVNFASLDPSITSTGRKGLTGASNLDKEVWNEFHNDWETLAIECGAIRLRIDSIYEEAETEHIPEVDFTGLTRQTMIEQRLKQNFFRKAVLTGYRERCCISGLADQRLLIASHIVPWSQDKKNRLNPSNGLCLSAIHDKAFDRGLITITNDYRVMLSKELRLQDDPFIKEVFHTIEGKKIELPTRFVPNTAFLEGHQNNTFLGI